MYSKKSIESYVGTSVYKSAEQLVNNGSILNMNVHQDEDTGVYFINAEVKSSHGSHIYHVDIILSEDLNWIVDDQCDCPYSREYYEPCKHIAAVLLYFLDHAAISSQVSSQARSTDPIMQSLLEQYQPDNTALPAVQAPSAPVEIEPHLNTDEADNHTLTVDFRIGVPGGHMYVLQNITDFTNAVRNHELRKYGKQLSFVHEISAFSTRAQRIVRFLLSLTDHDDKYTENNPYSYYGFYNSYYQYDAIRKTLSLKGRYLDTFMDIAMTMHTYMDNAKPPYIISIEDGNPNLSGSIVKAEDGYTFSGIAPVYFTGRDYLYFYDPIIYCIFRTKRDDSIMPLLKYLENADNEPVYIAPEDLPSFSRYVYPVVSDHMHLARNDFNPALYLPPKPVFEIYLDMPQENMITGELYAVYSDHKYNVLDNTGTAGNRDFESEKAADNAMSPWFNSFDPANKRLALANDDDKIYQFLKDGIPALQRLGTVYISDKLKKLQIHDVPKVNVGVSVSHDLLELDLVSEDLSMKQLAEILSRYDRKKKFYRLKNGDFVDLDASMNELADLTDTLSLTKQDITSGNIKVPKFRAMYLDEFGNDTDMDFHRDQNFRSLIQNMSDTAHKKYQLPKDLKADLRQYQKDGFRWLCSLHDSGFGALLADEMGLGKTLQVIAFLGAYRNEGRALVVCPASLVYNWSAEIEKFLPSLKSRMIQGPASVRKDLIAGSADDEVLITSYDLLKRDIQYYEGMHFFCEVIDEAQYIKNSSTQASKAVKSVDSSFRIALTGTPIENRLSELWSIFDYLMPGFFYSYQRFRDTFEKPIVNDSDKDVQNRLTKMITPFVLRRLKKDVLKDLPEKLEEVYYAPLEGEQKELYQARVQRLKMMLEKQSDREFKESKIVILSELTRLRQLCCDPELIYDGYKGNSDKEDLCIDMIKNAVEAGHKVLVFSQFTSMLDLLCSRLDSEKIKYYLLEGSTAKEKRAQMVQQFQTDDVPVFFISLKAGGTGLNLTAADIVIHYDPWWNTAVENQASDRAHRIGQKNTVTVYRLIMKDTVEEKILALQEEKSDLAGRILSGEGISSASLTKEDLLSILQ